MLRRPLPGLRVAAARRGLRLGPAAGAAGRAGPLLGFSCRRLLSRPAAQRCSSPVPRGRTVLGGGRAASARPMRVGPAGRGAGEAAGGSSRRCVPAPAVSTRPAVKQRGALRAAGSPSPPAPLAPPRCPLPALPTASRWQGPGRGGGGVQKVGSSQNEFSLFSPAEEHAEIGEAGAGGCAQRISVGKDVGEAAFKPLVGS